MNREVQHLVRELEHQGWRVARDTRHYKLYAPNGRDFVFMSKTPSDGCAFANTVARLRRHGFKWKGR